MKRTLQRLFVTLAATLGLALPAAATPYSTDYTDLWYRFPAESEAGWGVNIVQQGHIIFATMFVYGPDNTPRWYVGSAVVAVNPNTFTGTLYATTGTYFGVPWSGAVVNPVGTIQFNFSAPNFGVLTYTVGTLTIVKNITRQTWANNIMTGSYLGGMTANGSACRNGATNGPALIFGRLTVNHAVAAAPSLSIDFVSSTGIPGTCTFTGTYSQSGRHGAIPNGTFACTFQGQTGGNSGIFSMTEIFTSATGLTARFIGSDQFCNYDGFFGGVRDVL